MSIGEVQEKHSAVGQASHAVEKGRASPEARTRDDALGAH